MTPHLPQHAPGWHRQPREAVLNHLRRTPSKPGVRVAAAARAGWGCVLLFAPARLLSYGGRLPVPTAAVTTARVLGVRQLVQAAVTAARPTAGVTATGLAVDTIHAATDVGFAALFPRWRRVAVIDAAVATALAVAATRRRDSPPPP